MTNHFLQKNNKKDGFTLVETLIAISIFSVSIVGLMSVLASGISQTNYAKYKTTASYLAEEGIEYIRNMRDTYVLYGSDPLSGWNNFLTKTAQCGSANGCSFDDSLASFNLVSLQGMNINQCNNNNCELYYYNNYGKYSYKSLLNGFAGADSGYKRVINIKSVSPMEIIVSSTVSWTKNSGSFSITFSDNLLKWKGQ